MEDAIEVMTAFLFSHLMSCSFLPITILRSIATAIVDSPYYGLQKFIWGDTYGEVRKFVH
jgi:hypothetical protein